MNAAVRGIDLSQMGAAAAIALLLVKLLAAATSPTTLVLECAAVVVFVAAAWRRVAWSALDAAVALVLAADVASTWGSTYHPNTVQALADTTLGVCLYAWRAGTGERPARWLALALSFVGAFLASSHLFRYAAWAAPFRAHGFEDLAPFRNLFWSPWLPPAPPGEQATSVLALLYFPAVLLAGSAARSVTARAILAAVVAALLAVVAASYSRGLYLALGAAGAVVVAGALVYGLPRRRGAALLLAAALLPAVLLVALPPLRAGVVATLTRVDDAARGRSAAGRIAVWRTALDPRVPRFLGVGGGNFGRFYAETVPGEGVVRAYSAPVQWFVEGGIVGLTARVLLILAALVTGHRGLRRASDGERWPLLVALAFFFALLVRDLTYSALLGNPFVASVFWLLAGALRSER